MIVVQIAQKMGINITAVVSAKGVDLAKKWGATQVINYQNQSVQGLTDQFDAILDLSGKLPFEMARPLLTANGLFVNTTPTLKDIILTPIANLMRRQKVKLLMSSPDQGTLQILSQYANQGLDVYIGQSFDWLDFENAYAQIKQKGSLGKAVLTIRGA